MGVGRYQWSLSEVEMAAKFKSACKTFQLSRRGRKGKYPKQDLRVFRAPQKYTLFVEHSNIFPFPRKKTLEYSIYRATKVICQN